MLRNETSSSRCRSVIAAERHTAILSRCSTRALRAPAGEQNWVTILEQHPVVGDKSSTAALRTTLVARAVGGPLWGSAPFPCNIAYDVGIRGCGNFHALPWRIRSCCNSWLHVGLRCGGGFASRFSLVARLTRHIDFIGRRVGFGFP